MRLELPSEVNLETIPALIHEAEQLLKHHREPQLVLDFAQVRQFDMSGIGALVRIMEQCQQSGIEPRFENLREELSRLLAFVNLEELTKKQGPPLKQRGFVESLGRNIRWYYKDFLEFLVRHLFWIPTQANCITLESWENMNA